MKGNSRETERFHKKAFRQVSQWDIPRLRAEGADFKCPKRTRRSKRTDLKTVPSCWTTIRKGTKRRWDPKGRLGERRTKGRGMLKRWSVNTAPSAAGKN